MCCEKRRKERKEDEAPTWASPVKTSAEHEAPHVYTRDSDKLGHLSEYVTARFGLVDAKLSSQRDHPGLPI
jgi:hypothetical protein